MMCETHAIGCAQFARVASSLFGLSIDYGTGGLVSGTESEGLTNARSAALEGVRCVPHAPSARSVFALRDGWRSLRGGESHIHMVAAKG